jgi:tyrosine-protein kinase Etk/Wzc
LLSAASELLQKETKLRDQRRQYTDEYPATRAMINDLQQFRTQTIPAYAANAARALANRESVLFSRIKADSAKLEGIPGRSIQEAALRRNLSIAEGLYTSLDNKTETTRLGAASSIPDVTILYPALPAASSQRNTIILLVGGGIFGSLLLGIAIALLLDIIDHRFRYPEQITDELKLEVLGAVPSVPKPGEAADPEATLQSVEAFRGLRLNMHHAFDAPPVMLTVTSPGAGDGKSMIASNLALSFADAGYKTLLIDGDIRRGKLHSVFGIERRPGLLDYLAGDAELPAIMREAPMHTGLTIIPSGTRRHRGPELLTSSRLPALLNAARGKFDVIIMDSAPLAAGIDAYALGVAMGTMILVMRTGVTDRRVAKAKLKLMERMPVRVLGAVVNAVPASGLYSEYSDLYGYQPDVDIDGSAKTDMIPALQSVDPPR